MIVSRFTALIMAILLFTAQSAFSRPNDNDPAYEPYGRPNVIMSDETKQMILNEINLATAHLLLKIEDIKDRFRAVKRYFLSEKESNVAAESAATICHSNNLWVEWENRRELMILFLSDFRAISQSVKRTGRLACETPLPCERLIATLDLLEAGRDELLQLKLATERELSGRAHQSGAVSPREKQVLAEKIQFVAAADVVLELIAHR